jgi:hypothetical protein
MAPRLSLPKTLRIGSYTWKVRCGTKIVKGLDISKADGLCHVDTRIIDIRPGLELQYERIVLLHEILHACRDSSHVKVDLNDAEESFVNHVAPLLYGVLQDNNDLLDYLGLGL